MPKAYVATIRSLNLGYVHKKNKMKRILWFCFSTISSCLFAQAPKYSNEFLNIGVGADAFAMGNAVVAHTKDVTAAYWNPAALSSTTDWLQISAMHSEYFAGIAKYDYVGIAHSLGSKGVLGFTFLRFGVDDIPNTTQLIDNDGRINYDNITSFSAGDYAFMGTYSRALPVQGLSMGATFKVIHRTVGNFAKSWGFGLDAGIKYELKTHWKFGLVARDVTSTFNAWIFDLSPEMQQVFLSTGNELPSNGLEISLPRLIGGVAYSNFLGPKEKGFSILTELDFDVTTDGKRNTLVSADPFSVDPHAGLQLAYKDLVKLRGGVSSIQSFSNLDGSKYWGIQPNLGLGIGLKGFSIDYAFTRLGAADAGYYTHIFSLKFKLNAPKKML